jgi:hypothetical protein
MAVRLHCSNAPAAPALQTLPARPAATLRCTRGRGSRARARTPRPPRASPRALTPGPPAAATAAQAVSAQRGARIAVQAIARFRALFATSILTQSGTVAYMFTSRIHTSDKLSNVSRRVMSYTDAQARRTVRHSRRASAHAPAQANVSHCSDPTAAVTAAKAARSRSNALQPTSLQRGVYAVGAHRR